MSYKHFLTAGAVLAGIGMPVFGVLAQGSVGIAISPLTFELTANPGDTLTNSIKITNPNGGSLIIEMEVHDFSAAGDSGDVILDPGEDTTFSMERWVIAEPQRFTLGPNETVPVTFEIKVPTDAEPGGHYASVMATVKGSTDVTGSAISQKVGSLVLLSVAGPIREELFIREFTVPQFLHEGPVPFTVRLENTGSVHVKPLALITIADFSGRKVADIELPLKRVLPGNTRKIDVPWNKRYPIGKYTATFVGSFGISNTPISAVATFWVFPWKIALELVGAILIVAFVLIKTRKRFTIAFKILMKGEQAVSGAPHAATTHHNNPPASQGPWSA